MMELLHKNIRKIRKYIHICAKFTLFLKINVELCQAIHTGKKTNTLQLNHMKLPLLDHILAYKVAISYA